MGRCLDARVCMAQLSLFVCILRAFCLRHPFKFEWKKENLLNKKKKKLFESIYFFPGAGIGGGGLCHTRQKES